MPKKYDFTEIDVSGIEYGFKLSDHALPLVIEWCKKGKSNVDRYWCTRCNENGISVNYMVERINGTTNKK